MTLATRPNHVAGTGLTLRFGRHALAVRAEGLVSRKRMVYDDRPGSRGGALAQGERQRL